MPVFPDVASTTVPPGLSKPSRSAARSSTRNPIFHRVAGLDSPFSPVACLDATRHAIELDERRPPTSPGYCRNNASRSPRRNGSATYLNRGRGKRERGKEGKGEGGTGERKDFIISFLISHFSFERSVVGLRRVLRVRSPRDFWRFA